MNLEKFYLWNDAISTIPPEIGQLSKLTELHMYNNPELAGTIPMQLGKLTNLVELHMYNNKALTGTIPNTLGKLSKLRTLNLHNNKLNGTIPAQLGTCLL